MTSAPTFSPALFGFLRDLAVNNEREWFKEHKERYDAVVKEPALEFINAMAPRLEKISPHFVADSRPVGGSLFRIHRDTRFSKDKTPYKTHTGIQFRHESAKDVHAPGYYVHIEPRACFVGVGIWRPDTATARAIRNAIGEDAAAWKRAAYGKRFREAFTLEGDQLKRVPKEFPEDHPFPDDLRRKDFIATSRLTQRDVTSPAFADVLVRRFKLATPFMRFLCEATGVAF